MATVVVNWQSLQYLKDGEEVDQNSEKNLWVEEYNNSSYTVANLDIIEPDWNVTE